MDKDIHALQLIHRYGMAQAGVSLILVSQLISNPKVSPNNMGLLIATMPLLFCSASLAGTIFDSPRNDKIRKRAAAWTLSFFYAAFALNFVAIGDVFGDFNPIYRGGFWGASVLGLLGFLWSTTYLKKKAAD